MFNLIMSETPARIPSLDGLRAISISLVIFNHILTNLKIPDIYYNTGNLGVRIFFVISGFLITGLLLKELEKDGKINLWKFYFRRTTRIFIPFYFFVLVMFLMTLAGFIKNHPLYYFWPVITYTSNYIGYDDGNTGHSWSLAVEEQFYILFPGILAFLGLRYTKIALLFAMIIPPISRLAYYYADPDYHFVWGVTGFHHNMDSLAAGCLLAIFQNRLHALDLYRRLIASKIPLVFPLIIFTLNSMGSHRPKMTFLFGLSTMNILIAVLIDWAVVNHQGFVGKVLNCRVFTTIGLMSYSIYLWQQPFFNPDNPQVWTTFPLNFVLASLASIAGYYLIEKKSFRIRKYLEARLFKASGDTGS